MKKLLVIVFMATMFAACGDNKSRTSDVNSEENTEQSNELATPDTTGMEMDSLSTQPQQDTLQ
jgi:hypothetical protein